MQAIDIIGNIRAAFIDTLEKQDWMDNKTKEAAKQKVHNGDIKYLLKRGTFRKPYYSLYAITWKLAHDGRAIQSRLNWPIRAITRKFNTINWCKRTQCDFEGYLTSCRNQSVNISNSPIHPDDHGHSFLFKFRVGHLGILSMVNNYITLD